MKAAFLLNKPMTHKAGYVNIIGRPNVGKSTLLNQWLGEKISIITHKAQTTRHRILGILNDASHQVIFSDTPGFIFEPKNRLHLSMNQTIETALNDADIIVYLTEPGETPETIAPIIEKLKKKDTHKMLLINKCDLLQHNEDINHLIEKWKETGVFNQIFPVSALYQHGTQEALQYILSVLPENPPYFPKDQISDRSERFFVSEIIREKILLFYEKEIPYSVEVIIDSFKETSDIIKIRAIIYTERKSQKIILIGKNGTALKKVGIEARKDIEKLLGKKVFLELYVKVKEKWRNDARTLKIFGY
jgi:GTP-binding protein Era